MTQSLLQLFEENKGKYLDTDKEKPHFYISKFYSNEFEKYKNKKINLLEIGLGQGGSLLLWNDYFTEAKIYGLDNGKDGRFHKVNSVVKDYERISVIKSDAYSPDLIYTLEDFDIIIDDGPHTLESHLWFLEFYLPKLKSGGVAIIEDIDNIRWIEFYKKYVSDEYTYETIDTDRTIQYNNLLFVVRKK